MNRVEEFQYIRSFAVGSDMDVEICREQLRCLWTAYCLHQNFDVDTNVYDQHLCALWYTVSAFEENPTVWDGIDEFNNFMCAYLV